MTESLYKSNIAMLAKYFRYSLSPDYASLYWNMLKHLTDDDFNVAVTNIYRDFVPTATVPFPLVVHFLRYCGQAGDNQARAAISTLKRAIRRIGQYESVDFNDPALNYTVMAFGGWPAICVMSDKEWDINEGRILETYKTAVAVRSGDRGHLPGLSEIDGGAYRMYQITHNGQRCIAERVMPGQLEHKSSNAPKITNGAQSVGELLTASNFFTSK